MTHSIQLRSEGRADGREASGGAETTGAVAGQSATPAIAREAPRAAPRTFQVRLEPRAGQPSAVVVVPGTSSVDAPESPPIAANKIVTRTRRATQAPVTGSATKAEPPIRGLVKRAARPLVREWLDANMPRLLARALQREQAEMTRVKDVQAQK